MEDECVNGKGLGFKGKQCIHPDQVGIAQRCFSPSEKELVWAVRVSIANAKAEALGKGAWALDGSMVDTPVIGKSKALLERARACGMDLKCMEMKWQYQDPE